MGWLAYTAMPGGAMPVVEVILALGNAESYPIRFIVDSGAAASIVPRERLTYIPEAVAGAPTDTGLLDAHGKSIRGVRVEFDVRIREPGIPRTREWIWVVPGAGFALLGQTWFERFTVRFHNFPSALKGRRFCIHPPTIPARERTR
jgi:hypothetical protein